MELRRFKDIVAIKKDGEIWGFHSKNLQMAQLDPVAWEAFHHNTPTSAEAREELSQWNMESDSSVEDDRLKQKATTFVVNITQICNLRCTYCAAGGDGTYGDKKGKVDVRIIEPQIVQRLKALSAEKLFTSIFLAANLFYIPKLFKNFPLLQNLQWLEPTSKSNSTSPPTAHF